LALACVAFAAADEQGFAQNNAGGGSESIGSLPAMGPTPPGSIEHGLNRVPMRVVFQGRQEELRALILEVRLAGTLSEPVWTPLAAPGMAQVSFEGPLELTLDRRTLEQSFVTAKVEFGSQLLGGALQVSAAGRRSSRAITSRQLDLHLQPLSWSGMLEQGVTLQAVTPSKQPSRLTITAEGGKIRLVAKGGASPQMSK
jgi:hypothetical protein